jgi:predicted DNA-binding WGR domain protein
MQRYEFRDGSSQKFWEVSVEANTLTVRFGRIGTDGQVKTKTLASAAAAEKERAKLIKEKTGKGYVLCGEPGSTATEPPVALSPVAAVMAEFLKQTHAPGLYLACQPGLQTLNRMGGLPSLPTDVAWPLHLHTGRPLHFLAQVDLSTLPPLGAAQSGRPVGPGLPSSGLLFFFVDMGGDFDGGKAGASPGARVLYAAQAGAERAAPQGLPQIGHDMGSLTGKYASTVTVFEPQMLQPYAVDSYHTVEYLDPDDLEIDVDADDGGKKSTAKALAKWVGGQAKDYTRHLKDVDLEEAWEIYSAETINDAADEVVKKSLYAAMGRDADEAHPDGFYMLGAPLGGFDMAIVGRQKGYVSLLSVSGHTLTPSYYEDGLFQFWITPDDLAAARFERAWIEQDHS